MKITDVEQALKQIRERYGDLDVMFTDPNSSSGPYSVEHLFVETADEDEYPDHYNMPGGFTFVDIQN